MERMQFVLFIMASGSGSECRNDQSKKKNQPLYEPSASIFTALVLTQIKVQRVLRGKSTFQDARSWFVYFFI